MKPMQSSKKYLFGFHFSGFLEMIYLTTVTWLWLFAWTAKVFQQWSSPKTKSCQNFSVKCRSWRLDQHLRYRWNRLVNLPFRVIFILESKVIRDFIGFNLLCSLISPGNWHLSLKQSDAKQFSYPRFPRFRLFGWFYFDFSFIGSQRYFHFFRMPVVVTLVFDHRTINFTTLQFTGNSWTKLTLIISTVAYFTS